MLPESVKLVWKDLPRFFPLRGAAVDPHGHVSDEMENPPVNPVTGPGRTAADVAGELEAYKQRIRTDGRLKLSPIFQADFLFIRLPNGNVGLHRVVNGLCIEASVARDVAFTTVEYHHNSQDGFPGFWGHFEMKENPHYTAADRKSGTKFERHHEITRAEVLVTDVQVFSVRRPKPDRGNLLYVSVSSLRELATKGSVQPAIPATLPATHAPAQDPQEPGRAQGARSGRGRAGRGRAGRGRGRRGAGGGDEGDEGGDESG